MLSTTYQLKIGAFKPEYVGKMNFYLGLLDKYERQPDENPSIYIILCADKDHLDVEVALPDISGMDPPIYPSIKKLETRVLSELRNMKNVMEEVNE